MQPFDRWIEAWMRIFAQVGPVKIIITGGEPTLYPEFIRLLAFLTQYHRVSFDTNLFRNSGWVQELSGRIVPQHTYVGMSFHPEFAKIDEFSAKARIIHDTGAECRVHLVCYPPLLKDVPKYYATLSAAGLKVIPYPFRGNIDGRAYPQSYTMEEKAVILQMLGQNLSEKNQFWVERQLDPVDPFGRLCYAGQRYARIDNDGSVWRCNQYFQNDQRPMGNIFERGFELFREPRVCASHQCGCEWWWLIDYYERRHQA